MKAASLLRVWRDPAFLTLAAAGPVVALVLGAAGLPVAPANLAPWLLIVVFPLAEELAFRGLLQGQLLRFEKLRRSRAGFSAANLVVTALFVLAHLPLRGPLTAVLVLVPSLAFGWVRDRYAAVWPAAVLHGIYNASGWSVAALLR